MNKKALVAMSGGVDSSVCAYLAIQNGYECIGATMLLCDGQKALSDIEDAKAVEAAGAFAVVLECVPAKLAELVTKELQIPTIGIGAGNMCDGQVLVYQDMLGMFSDFAPKFVKHFANVGTVMKEAFKTYCEEVQSGAFPAKEHEYTIADDVLEKLY